MRLLVVTPTLGGSEWLDDCLNSVDACAPGAAHVLVSPPAVVEALRHSFPNRGLLAESDPGGGMYSAINDALETDRDWDAFTYLNDDDVLLPGFAASRRALEGSGTKAPATVIYGSVALISPASRRLGMIPVSPWPRLVRTLYAERLEPVYQHGTIITREAWEQHGGFDGTFKYCGDSEYLARLCVRGVPAVRVGSTVAAFRLRKGQLTKNRAAMVAERRRVDEKLGLLAGPSRRQRLFARWVFRLANAPVYAERVARHGFLSFDEVLARAG
jgi:GT2 family glycosyltransferase